MAKPSFNENTTSVNILGPGTSITGDVSCEGDIRIDGNLIGNLKSKGKLVIGQTGSIKGEIICKNADISGVLEGKITVEELLSLKSTSKLIGDIKNTDKLNIEPGAVFTGTCNMGGIVSHKINPPVIPPQMKSGEQENSTK
ncbi:MAG: polymer-forming cytoskeletal protein [Bacteroidales bacterium]|nr:polymer-forming cytoskeletal protein [Bacteroidales bacterium]